MRRSTSPPVAPILYTCHELLQGGIVGELPAWGQLLGEARFHTYMSEAGEDTHRAIELYQWSTALAGAFVPQLAHFEVLTRNSLNSALRVWNSRQPGYLNVFDWALDDQTAPRLYSLIGKDLGRARVWARQQASDREVGHPRRNAAITHDDVLAQLTMGTWVKLLGAGAKQDAAAKQTSKDIWVEHLHVAFPNAGSVNIADSGRRRSLGARYARIAKLRNRISHHEHLLHVDVRRRVNDLLSVLGEINPDLPAWVMEGSRIRQVNSQDPRKTR